VIQVADQFTDPTIRVVASRLSYRLSEWSAGQARPPEVSESRNWASPGNQADYEFLGRDVRSPSERWKRPFMNLDSMSPRSYVSRGEKSVSEIVGLKS